ncbi:zinc-finger of monoamine-oxidase A repressor R1, partial [Trifolium medium]|nr:zinc-finger of monoamine-oxidase A repressor R1 [Trifolium medium]
AKIAEEKKAAKSKVAEAKEKERSLKQQLQDEMAKAVISNGNNLSISEYDALVSKIKSEAAKAHTELLEA